MNTVSDLIPACGQLLLAQQQAPHQPDAVPFVCCCSVIVLVVIAVAVGAAGGKPARCDICGVGIRRSAYRWTIQGKKHWLCPNCSRRIADHKSKAAVGRLLGDPGARGPGPAMGTVARASSWSFLDLLYRLAVGLLLAAITLVAAAILISKYG